MVLPRNAHSPFGHHFFVGLRPTSTLADEDKRMLERLGPAGVILFGANFLRDRPYEEWLEVQRRLVADIREHAGRDEILIAIDHEGHGIVRPPEPITAYAHARDWADQAGEVAAAMAAELSSLGINVNFAPVLDIDSAVDSPIIGRRAFGTDAESVGRAGAAFVRSLQAGGVLACLKHFPGHGAAAQDSHYTLPVVDLSLDELRERELRPFAEVIRQGARLIMTAHLQFPRIDPEPATFSGALLQDVLRGELGYDGVVVTDDIGMSAVAERFGSADDALDKALGAGTDLIMICSYWTDTDRAYDMARDIEARRDRGAIAGEALEASRERIERLLTAAPVNQVTALSPAQFEAHRAVAPLGRRSSSALSESQTVQLQKGAAQPPAG